MSTAPNIVSWGKGELSPQERGRVDAEIYYSSMEEMENVKVRPYGNVINRAGSIYVGTVKDSTKKTRLIKFVFNVVESYIIEMGEFYFRFFNNGARLELSSTPDAWVTSTAYVQGNYVSYGGSNYYCMLASTGDIPGATDSIYWYVLEEDIIEIPHDYSESQIFDVHIAQKNDVIYLAHGEHPPATLIRSSAETWTLTDIVFVNGPWDDDNVTATKMNPGAAAVGSTTLVASAATFEAQRDIGRYIKINTTYTDGTTGQEVQGYGQITAVSDSTNATLNVIVKLRNDNNTLFWAWGAWYENSTFGDAYNAGTTYTIGIPVSYLTLVYYSKTNGNIGNTPDSSPSDWGTTVISYGAEVGNVWEVGAYVELNDIIYVANSQNQWKIPYNYPAVWSVSETFAANFPATVSFHEARLGWARTKTDPQRVWLSKSFVYDDFEPGDEDDKSIRFDLNTEQANDIKWIMSGNALASGTSGGEFITNSADGGKLTPDTANAKRQTGWGSEKLQPRKIANFIYYLQRGARKIRELFYFWDQDNYKSADMTKYAEHITLSGVVDMDYQQNPDSVLWCVLNNGNIATLTRDVDEEVQAWTRIETDGDYKSVQVIPSPDGINDQVWVIVERTIEGSTVKYVEYFDNDIVEDDTLKSDLYYMDGGSKFVGGLDGTVEIQIEENVFPIVTITDTATTGYFNSANTGDTISIYNEIGEVYASIIIQYSDPNTVFGVSDYDFPAQFTIVPASDWGITSNTYQVPQLALETVAILADGVVQDQQVVASDGTVTLSAGADKVSVGLPYSSLIKTNPINVQTPTGTAQAKIKRIAEISLRVYRTLGISVGSEEDDLAPITPPAESSQTALYTGLYENISFNGDWDKEGQIIVKQSNPLPMNILGIFPKVVVQDKS